MRNFNYSEISNKKWDSEVLGLIAAIYKEAGKQELYLKQRPAQLEKLVEVTENIKIRKKYKSEIRKILNISNQKTEKLYHYARIKSLW